VDQGVARLEGGNFAFVVIDTYDIVADLSEADGGDQTDVSRTNNSYLNGFAHGFGELTFCIATDNSSLDHFHYCSLAIVKMV